MLSHCFKIIMKTYRVYHAFVFTQISNMATNMPVKLVLRGTSNISLNERWGYLRAPTAVTLYILLTVIMTQYGTVTSHCVWSLHPYTSVHISGIEPYMMSWEIFLHKWSKPFWRQLNNTVVQSRVIIWVHNHKVVNHSLSYCLSISGNVAAQWQFVRDKDMETVSIL